MLGWEDCWVVEVKRGGERVCVCVEEKERGRAKLEWLVGWMVGCGQVSRQLNKPLLLPSQK